MTAKMKYICFLNAENNSEEIITFPTSIDHDCMAEVANKIKDKSWGAWERVRRQPISAGFTDGEVCYGESLTLNLKSREEDTAILQAGGRK